jgi:hypothetical protein
MSISVASQVNTRAFWRMILACPKESRGHHSSVLEFCGMSVLSSVCRLSDVLCSCRIYDGSQTGMENHPKIMVSSRKMKRTKVK